MSAMWGMFLLEMVFLRYSFVHSQPINTEHDTNGTNPSPKYFFFSSFVEFGSFTKEAEAVTDKLSKVYHTGGLKSL